LHIPCIWEAMQCLEKYLKAILLYNFVPVKEIGHDLPLAYRTVLSIRDIDFDFPPDVPDFLSYLQDEGLNRYFDFPYALREGFLQQLDRTVWYLRRYCSHYRYTVELAQGRTLDAFPDEIRVLQSERYKRSPTKFRLRSGFIETTLDSRKCAARRALVWKNFYYGARRRHIIRNFPVHIASASPTHYNFPQYLSLIREYIRLPKAVVDILERENEEQRRAKHRDPTPNGQSGAS
jgi:hypothetical protein